MNVTYENPFMQSPDTSIRFMLIYFSESVQSECNTGQSNVSWPTIIITIIETRRGQGSPTLDLNNTPKTLRTKTRLYFLILS
jgi:hypothetical protein